MIIFHNYYCCYTPHTTCRPDPRRISRRDRSTRTFVMECYNNINLYQRFGTCALHCAQELFAFTIVYNMTFYLRRRFSNAERIVQLSRRSCTQHCSLVFVYNDHPSSTTDRNRSSVVFQLSSGERTVLFQKGVFYVPQCCVPTLR